MTGCIWCDVDARRLFCAVCEGWTCSEDCMADHINLAHDMSSYDMSELGTLISHDSWDEY